MIILVKKVSTEEWHAWLPFQKLNLVGLKIPCYLGYLTIIKLSFICVVYFDQLLGAARTQKLVETFFSAVFHELVR